MIPSASKSRVSEALKKLQLTFLDGKNEKSTLYGKKHETLTRIYKGKKASLLDMIKTFN